MVAQDVGVAVLPEAAAQRHSGTLPVAIVTLDDSWATRELQLCVRSPEGLSSQGRQLVAYLTGTDEANQLVPTT